MPIPFYAVHHLESREEIRTFRTVNSEVKMINKSLLYYLSKEVDEMANLATQLIEDADSPFVKIGSLAGKRKKAQWVTTQQLFNATQRMFKFRHVMALPAPTKVALTKYFWNWVAKTYEIEWYDAKEYRLTQALGISSLSLVAQFLFAKHVPLGMLDPRALHEETQAVDMVSLRNDMEKALLHIDWSVDAMQAFKGTQGPLLLAMQQLQKAMSLQALMDLQKLMQSQQQKQVAAINQEA